MNYRVAFAGCFLLLIGSLLLNLTGQAQEAEADKPASRQYTVTAVGTPASYLVIVCDALSGQGWSKASHEKAKWSNYGSPAAK